MITLLHLLSCILKLISFVLSLRQSYSVIHGVIESHHFFQADHLQALISQLGLQNTYLYYSYQQSSYVMGVLSLLNKRLAANKKRSTFLTSSLTGHIVFFKREKYGMTNHKPYTIFFTCEENHIGFSRHFISLVTVNNTNPGQHGFTVNRFLVFKRRTHYARKLPEANVKRPN